MKDVEELKQHAYDVIGALHEVHSVLGPGLNEAVYQEGLEIELRHRNIPFERELTFHPQYKGEEMKTSYRVDFLCKKDIIVELKSVADLCQEHRAQLFNYMRLLNAPVGVLINMASEFAQIERYFYDREKHRILRPDGSPF